ncbi:hypothetical protein [Pseudooceanicola nanhaiensis]|uniref:hypothetical protein n=1 Tax=Pseudooceanicola nanhaiensis TaxID=375761 RepID=UPI00351658F3
MSRIVIHAGFHKTGTSTPQAWLGAARGPLRPHAKIVPARGMQALLHACRACSTLPEPKSPAKVAARAEAFARGIAGLKGRALILSADALSGHPPGRPGIDSCAAAPVLLAELTAALARRFPRAAIHVALTTRAPGPWLRSAHREHLRSAAITEDAASFAARLRPAADLSAAEAAVAAGLPHPVHRPPLEATPDPRAALLRLAGVPDTARAALPPPRHRNAARPAALDDLLHINRTISDRAARRDAKTARPRQAAGTR